VLRTSSLEFLYPKGTTPVPASDVTLELPVRVGLAFVPSGTSWASGPITADQQQALLQRIADAFRERDVIASLEVIPTTYLQPGGGFDNLYQLRATFGVDLIGLVSYEQTQFSETTGSSIAYWTILGAYIVRGEKNETRTMLEAVVFDIPSHALLLRAGGTSEKQTSATPIGVERTLRLDAEAGFESAVVNLISNLNQALDAFEVQSKTGTVRGVGTPAITLVEATGTPGSTGGSGGGGALGLADLLLCGLLAVPAWAAARARPRS